MSYCFVCLFRADKSTSGLALRIPTLWKSLAEQGEDVSLIINKSLYDKTINEIDSPILEKVYIIPENLGFKVSCLFYVTPLLLYLIAIKKTRRFHLSVGGAYFIDYLRLLEKSLSDKIIIHTSIGSKNLEMIVAGNKKSRYYQLHLNLLNKCDKVDCLYSPNGFPQHKQKCLQSPGSFSWRYNTQYIQNLELPYYKNDNIVFCGILTEAKNYRLAIKSYKKLLAHHNYKHPPNLIIIAPEVSKDLLFEINDFNKGSTGKIIFKDYKDINQILKDAYIFLSLQIYDNYPSQSLIEAMAFGCTIIATDVGETRKMINENHGNLLISNNVNDLVEAIITLMERPHYTNFLNKEFIMKNHTLESYSSYFKNNFLT